MEFINGFDEVYSNENQVSIQTMVKVHGWLMKHHVALLVNYGLKQKNRTGVVVATKDRLLLIELRDYRLIRTPKQTGITAVKSKEINYLNANTESTEPELYATFVKKIKKGKFLT